ncbi:hypothetical protein GCM10010909_11360 [Acidocella aquatica]|uniref:Uncharacterized protein n=1 Tax=Acidocella aquatica TaxID=1922313 RepID=A0ABQ6A1Z4_9PROT|nr:hypothetical protein [Acidocella aquatica]GLR66456.1 hypothetical protein GCM10010909_11360 [Acidocella aquatica]
MIRPLTLLSAILFFVSGAYLFVVKHHAQMLDDQIAAVTQATRLDQQRIRVLQAQWALEADPSRLAQLSTQFTTLQPMKPNQLMTLAALGSALPAPGSAAPGPNPLDAVPVLPVVAPMPAAVASAVQSAGQTMVQPAVKMAGVQPVAKAMVHLARAQGVVGADKAAVHLASADAQPRSLLGQAHMAHVRHNKASVTHEYAQNRPAFSAQPLAAVRPPMGAQVMSVRAVAQAVPMASAQDDGGSLLGMAQSGSGN